MTRALTDEERDVIRRIADRLAPDQRARLLDDLRIAVVEESNATEARDYDPMIGRWTTRDPAGFEAEIEANRYTYSRSDPINRLDVNGEWSISLSAYAGLGGAIILGRSPGGKSFLTFRYGVGTGGSLVWDPDGTFPSDRPGPCPPLVVSMGLFATAGVSAIFAQFTPASAQIGLRAQPGELSTYGKVSLLKWTVRTVGLGGGWSTGVEVSMF